jgi:hypothetical protein
LLGRRSTTWVTLPALVCVCVFVGFFQDRVLNYLPRAGFKLTSSWALPPEY